MSNNFAASPTNEHRCGSSRAVALCLLLLSAASLLSPPLMVQAAFTQSQEDWLTDLYHAWNGTEWQSSTGWTTTGSNPCGRYGLQCSNGSAGVLERITLTKNMGSSSPLCGAFPEPPAIWDGTSGLFPNVSHFYASDNMLTGPLPSGRSLRYAFPNLVRFVVSGNEITGPIPEEWSSINSLEWVDLRSNHITHLPERWGPQMDTVHLKNNDITGTLPNSWASSPLRYVSLDSNHLNGTLPPEWGMNCSVVAAANDSNMLCHSLFGLFASDNILSGAIPEQWSSMSSLVWITLRSNNYITSLPERLGPKVSLLLLDKNNISGTLPSSWTSSPLGYVYVQNNRLHGTLPPEWGMNCSSASNRLCHSVLSVQAHDNELSGAIPEEWSGMSRLDSVGLSTNRLTKLPERWGPKARVLYLHNNSITGTLPSSWTSSPLGYVFLEHNRLNGTLPQEWGMNCSSESNNLCQSLSRINARHNELSGGIPEEWSSMSTLGWVSLGSNHLTHLPERLGPKMDTVLLDINDIIGTLPSGWASSPLTTIWLAGNELSGAIPEEWSNMNTLAYVNLNTNRLTQLPERWAPKVVTLYLDDNNLTGTLPSSWASSTLQKIFLRHNHLNGTLPQEWGMSCSVVAAANDSNMLCHSLSELYADFNNLSGVIPEEWSNITSLRTVDLSSNHITQLPERLGPALDFVDVGWNDLVGTLPRSWTSSPLTSLYLANNRLNGTLPAEWGMNCSVVAAANDSNKLCHSLRLLVGSMNDFEGTLPAEWVKMNISQLQLNLNRLEGNLTDEWGSFNSLTTLDLSGNSITGSLPCAWNNRSGQMLLQWNWLSGALPDCWGTMEHVTVLNLGGNRFEGTLPPSWSGVSASTLSLAENKLSGTLPESWATMPNLDTISLARNRITGSIPDNWLSNSTTPLTQQLTWMDLSGNPELTGTLPALGKSPKMKLFSVQGTSTYGSVPHFNASSMVYLDVTSISPKMLPLSNVADLSLVSPFFGRNTAETPSCADWSAPACFTNAFVLIPSPSMLRRTPQIFSDRFQASISLVFYRMPKYSWQQQAILNPEVSGVTEAMRDLWGTLENFLRSRYVLQYKPEIVPVGGANGDRDLDDSTSRRERQQTPGFVLSGVLLTTELDITKGWRNITIRHGVAYRVQVQVLLFDQWVGEQRFQKPANVPNATFGRLNMTFRTPVFYRGSCNSRLFAVPNTTSCVPCPEGMVCNGTTVLATASTTWRPRLDVLPTVDCPGGGGCVSNGNGLQCQEHYSGALCATCDEGYGKFINACIECPAMSVSIAIVAALALFELIYTTWVISCAVWDPDVQSSEESKFPFLSALSARSDVPLKIIFNHLALMGLVSATQLADLSIKIGESAAAKMLSWQYLFGNFAIYDVLAVDCLSANLSATDKFVLALVTLGALVLCQLLFIKIIKCITRLRMKTLWRTHPGSLRPWLSALVCIIRITHPTVISYSASIIPCSTYNFYNQPAWTLHEPGTPMPPPDLNVSILNADSRIDCDEAFTLWQGLGWACLVGLGLGIPGFCALVAGKVRRDEDHETMAKSFAFMVDNFTANMWYWESVLMVREVAGFVILAIMADADVQVIAMNTLLVACVTLHGKSQPYITAALNKAEYFSLGAAFVTLNTISLLGVYDRQGREAKAGDLIEKESDINVAKGYCVVAILAVQAVSLLAVVVSAGMYLLEEARDQMRAAKILEMGGGGQEDGDTQQLQEITTSPNDSGGGALDDSLAPLLIVKTSSPTDATVQHEEGALQREDEVSTTTINGGEGGGETGTPRKKDDMLS